jgi:hypothetical protein
MSRTLTIAGLVVDSWRDQSPQREPSEMNRPGSTIPISQTRATSDDEPPTPGLMSLIVVGAVKWKSHQGE